MANATSSSPRLGQPVPGRGLANMFLAGGAGALIALVGGWVAILNYGPGEAVIGPAPVGPSVAAFSAFGPKSAAEARREEAREKKRLVIAAKEREIVEALPKSSIGRDQATRAIGEELALPLERAGYLGDLAFSPDGELLAAASQGGTYHVWDLRKGKKKFDLVGKDKFGLSVAFSPDGKTLACTAMAGRVELWDMETGAVKKDLVGGGPLSYFQGPCFSMDGKQVYAGGNDGLHRWDVESAKGSPLHEEQHATVDAFALRPGGQMYATGGKGNERLRLFDLETGKPYPESLSGAWPLTLAFSPSGRLLAVKEASKEFMGFALNLYDMETGALVQQPKFKETSVRHLAFSPDEKWVAFTGNIDPRNPFEEPLFLWDLAEKKERVRLRISPRFAFQGLAFSPGGTMLATADSLFSGGGPGAARDEHTIRIWSMAELLKKPAPPPVKVP